MLEFWYQGCAVCVVICVFVFMGCVCVCVCFPQFAIEHVPRLFKHESYVADAQHFGCHGILLGRLPAPISSKLVRDALVVVLCGAFVRFSDLEFLLAPLVCISIR